MYNEKLIRVVCMCLVLVLSVSVFFACTPSDDGKIPDGNVPGQEENEGTPEDNESGEDNEETPEDNEPGEDNEETPEDNEQGEDNEETPEDNDAPVLLSFKIAGLSGSSAAYSGVQSIGGSVFPAYKTIPNEIRGDLPDLRNYDVNNISFMPKAKISLEIKIQNPEGYSISRFKINGTAFTSGSFTTMPIEIGSTTTTIVIGGITLPDDDITYSISDIKYISEFNSSANSEKDVVIPEQVQSLTVNVIKDGQMETDGVVYKVYQNEVYVQAHQRVHEADNTWSQTSSAGERVSLIIPAQIDGKNVVAVTFGNNNMLTNLDVPETVETLSLYMITNLKTLTMRMVAPPAVESIYDYRIGGSRYEGGQSVPGIPSGLKIYVPADSVAAYKAAPGWGEFADIIFAIEE